MDARQSQFVSVEDAVSRVADVAERVLGLKMFDVQKRGARALAAGKIVEMQTGEGKTLAATPAVAWYAREGKGVHVMTVNDYLARRDSRWMGPIYEALGFTVGCIQQTMSTVERRAAYLCDITYSTANEIGFDLLRDQIALDKSEQVHRPLHAAVVDEADSILIDEARIPLVLAGGEREDVQSLARRVDPVAREFQRGVHFTLDEFQRNIALTDLGIEVLESSLGCENLFAEENYALYNAANDAIHANHLLRRDVDYVVKDGAIESVDEFKGRVAPDRRWPAGLHTAVEAKEGLAFKRQGRILGSMMMQNIMALYPNLCGMTGTAATQAGEFFDCYGLEVEVIPTHRPVIRRDEPDVVFPGKAAKESAVLEEIRRIHATGQPILVGTSSVEESERLSSGLSAVVPHAVLNARNEEEEAGIIARAGLLNAVTISTNMAGRGVDIQLGEGVAGLGGLYVIGMNRHASRRIDHQLRGRAGRQGDPGRSRFFISLEDDLLVKHGDGKVAADDIERLQRVVEGQHLDARQFLNKYEDVIEGQRQRIQAIRQKILDSGELDRVALMVIDDLWSDHLVAVSDLRSGAHWSGYASQQPLHHYLKNVDELFREMEAAIPEAIAQGHAAGVETLERGATWTYLTTDQPFGSMTERIMRGLLRKVKSRTFWD